MRRAFGAMLVSLVLAPGPLARAADASLDALVPLIDAGDRQEALELAEELYARIKAETEVGSRRRAERLDRLLFLLRDRAHVGGPLRLPDAWTDRAAEAATGDASLAIARYALMLADARRAAEAREQLERLASLVHEGASERVQGRLETVRATLAELERDPAADRLYRRAIELLGKARPTDEGWWSETQGRLRLFLAKRGRADESIEPMRRYLEQVEDRYGPGDPHTLHALFNLVTALYTAQQHEQVIEPATRLLSISARSFGDHSPRQVTTRNLLGGSLLNLGRYAEAAEFLETSLAGYEGAPPEVERRLTRLMTNAATAHSALGNFYRAAELRARAIEVLAAADDPFSRSMLATVLRYQGVELMATGDLDAAERALRSALELQQQFHGPTHDEVAKSRLRLAELALDRDDPGAARIEIDRAIADLGPLAAARFDPALAQLWIGRARLVARDGDAEAARQIAGEVVAYYRSKLGTGNPRGHSSMIWLARMQRAAGDPAAALQTADRVIAERETRGLTYDNLYSQALEERAAALVDTGDPAGALEAAARASRAVDARVRDLAAGLPEARVERMLGTRPKPERFLFSLAAHAAADVRSRAVREAWEWTLRRRGVLLEELALRHRAAVVSATAKEAAVWDDLVRARRRLAALWVAGPGDDPEAFQQQLASAVRAREQAERSVIASHRTLGRRLRAQRVGLDEVLAAIPAATVVIEIVRAPTIDGMRDFALIARPDRTLQALPLGTAREIDRLVEAWRSARSATARARRPSELAPLLRAGRDLRRVAWEPVVSWLEGVEHVLLVPDGPFHLFHPGALPEDAGRFVMERGPSIHLLSTSRDLVSRGKAPESQGRGLLALGAPDFGASPDARVASLDSRVENEVYRGAAYGCFGLTETEWPELPATLAELESVAALYESHEPTLVKTAGAASEELLRAVLPGKRLAHIATHGFFVPREECEVGAATPLLRSGLILAGASRRDAAGGAGDDGVLTAEELATLDLDGLQRVVLSACDTGRGDVTTGEGVLGLRHALEIAGARTLVMSLAVVSDAWTERWMNSFYEDLIAGRSTREAVRNASLGNLAALRARGLAEHPSRWAAFVSSGDWR